MNKNKCRMWDGRVKRYFYDPNIVLECLKQQMCGVYDHESEGVVFEWGIGLNDINGVEIYDKDILQVTTNWYLPKKQKSLALEEVFDEFVMCETIWTVEYKNYMTTMGFYAFGKDRRFKTLLCKSRIINVNAVIIGNIHDNPELLED